MLLTFYYVFVPLLTCQTMWTSVKRILMLVHSGVLEAVVRRVSKDLSAFPATHNLKIESYSGC